MASLNNKGWGISNMITFLVIFIIFIFIIAFLVYNLDHEDDSNIQLMEENMIVLAFNN